MRASSPKLATEVAARLNAVIPSPFRLVAEGGELHVYVGPELDSIMDPFDRVSDGDSSQVAEEIAGALDSVLNTIQDDVSEYLRTPWPSADGRFMASVGVRSDAEHVFLWYGDERAPVLGLPPIRVADVVN